MTMLAEKPINSPKEASSRPTFQIVFKRLWANSPFLTSLGLIMTGVFGLTLLGLLLDPRTITGAPAWLKPAKFAISLSIYTFTFVWLLGFLKEHSRFVKWAARATAISFVIEMVIICGQVIRGTTSHFNSDSPLDGILFGIMGLAIAVAWFVCLGAAILLSLKGQVDPAFALALRLGLFLTFVGMAVAFLMLIDPVAARQAAQAAGQSTAIIGAHSVGTADGGPGLPLLGWSTVAGDLRVAHFLGLHALQILPLLGWLITRRFGRNLNLRTQMRLVWTAGLGYLGLIGLLTWQALRGQSVIAPDGLTLGLTGLLVVGICSATGLILARKNSI